MRSVIVVITNILRQQPLQVGFVECDDVVEQFTPSTFDPPLGDSVLPGTFKRGSHGGQIHRAYGDRDFRTIFPVAVEDQESRCRPVREGFAQLLHNPSTRRVPCAAEMQDAATVMTDDEEAVQHAERERWDRKEIHRRNRFPMVSQEREPSFAWFRVPRRPLHPSRDRSLRDIKSEHEKLTVNSRRPPRRVLDDHPEDQIASFDRDGNRGTDGTFPVSPSEAPTTSSLVTRSRHPRPTLLLHRPIRRDPRQLHFRRNLRQHPAQLVLRVSPPQLKTGDETSLLATVDNFVTAKAPNFNKIQQSSTRRQ
jgi:hypothetical protein